MPCSSESVDELCEQLGYCEETKGANWTLLKRLTLQYIRDHENELPKNDPDSKEAKEFAASFCDGIHVRGSNSDEDLTYGVYLWSPSDQNETVWHRDQNEILELVARLMCRQMQHKSSRKKKTQEKSVVDEPKQQTPRKEASDLPSIIEKTPVFQTHLSRDNKPQVTIKTSHTSFIDEAVNYNSNDAPKVVIDLESYEDETQHRQLADQHQPENFAEHLSPTCTSRHRIRDDASWSPSPADLTLRDRQLKRQKTSIGSLGKVIPEKRKLSKMPRLSRGITSQHLGTVMPPVEATGSSNLQIRNAIENETFHTDVPMSPDSVPGTSSSLHHFDFPHEIIRQQSGLRTPPPTNEKISARRIAVRHGEAPACGPQHEYQRVSETLSLSRNVAEEPQTRGPTANLLADDALPISPPEPQSSTVHFCVIKYHNGIPGLSQPLSIMKLLTKGLDFTNCNVSQLFRWYHSFSEMPTPLLSFGSLFFVFYVGSVRRHWEIESDDPQSALESLRGIILEIAVNYPHLEQPMIVEISPPGWIESPAAPLAHR